MVDDEHVGHDDDAISRRPQPRAQLDRGEVEVVGRRQSADTFVHGRGR